MLVYHGTQNVSVLADSQFYSDMTDAEYSIADDNIPRVKVIHQRDSKKDNQRVMAPNAHRRDIGGW